MLIFLHILIKHSQNYATRKNSSKLNFARKCQASQVIADNEKSSKCFSLTQPGNAQKVRLHHWYVFIGLQILADS